MKLVHIVALGAMIIAAAVIVGVERPAPARSAGAGHAGGITVTGSATAKSTPDQASFSFGVDTDGATASAALAANAAKMRRVLHALRQFGIARGDIQTTDVSVYPNSDDNGNRIGFSAHDSVSVKVSVRRAGRAIDAASAAGATDLSGPSFDRSDRDSLYRAALRSAVGKARVKALALADASHLALGRITRIDEQDVEPGPVPLYAAQVARSDSTPIEPGTQETRATVTVTFSVS